VTDALHLVSALARRVGSAPPAEPLAARMCRAVVELLDADGGAVTCAPTEDSRFTACATDPLASRLGDLEEVAGEGPGLRAYREQRSVGVLVGQRGPTSGFPLYEAAAVEAAAVHQAGPVSVRSWPVRAGGVPVAVLTLYARGVPVRPHLAADGQVLADALAGALGDAVAPAPGRVPRARVHRAVGMVVAQTGLPPTDALALIRARAFAASTGVEQVADQVLDRRLRFDDHPPARL
jgi:hypothetical protein